MPFYGSAARRGKHSFQLNLSTRLIPPAALFHMALQLTVNLRVFWRCLCSSDHSDSSSIHVPSNSTSEQSGKHIASIVSSCTRGQDKAGDCVAPQLSRACRATPLMAIYCFLSWKREAEDNRILLAVFRPSLPFPVQIPSGSQTVPKSLHPFRPSRSLRPRHLFCAFRNLIHEHLEWLMFWEKVATEEALHALMEADQF